MAVSFPYFFRRLSRLVRPPDLVPPEYRRTFLHLYMDVVWFGILNGTTMAFIAVYATRLGATIQQIGWLTAAPAVVNLIFALPVGSWLSHRSVGRTVFWASIFQRLFYLLLVPLPMFLLPSAQIWVIILMTLLMTIPGTAVVVGFNTLFGDVVPLEWRGYVVGIRNAALAVTSTLFTLIAGQLLTRLPFPTGYQIVFALGFVGAALSSLHLFFLYRIVGKRQKHGPQMDPAATQAGRKLDAEIRRLVRRGVQSLRLDTLRGKYGRVLLLLFGWHLFQYTTIPIVTPFVVNELHLADQTISLAAALFNGLTFVGSLLLSRVTRRFGNRLLTGGGIMALALFPIVTSFGAGPYLVANLIGGFAWAIASGGLYNYILENSPGSDLPAHLAWYNLVFNAAILIGSVAGPGIAGWIGYQPALLLFGGGRFLAGLAIILWG